MILQVLADARHVANHGDAQRGEMRARADARKLEDLRRPNGAGAQDHLATRARDAGFPADTVSDTDSAAVFDHHALDQRPGHDMAVRAATSGRDVGAGGRIAPAAACGRMIVAGACLRLRTIEVRRRIEADLGAGRQEGIAQLVPVFALGDLHGAVAAAVLGLAVGVAFQPPEVRQAVLERPALVAHLAPLVIIRGEASDIDHAVDCARAADHLAARPVDAAPVELRLGLGREFPVHGGIEEGLGKADRNRQPGAPGFRARLQQQDGMAPRRRQAIDDRAAGRPRPDDDEIKLIHPCSC